MDFVPERGRVFGVPAIQSNKVKTLEKHVKTIRVMVLGSLDLTTLVGKLCVRVCGCVRMCARVRACARVCARTRACVCVCVCFFFTTRLFELQRSALANNDMVSSVPTGNCLAQQCYPWCEN